MTGHTRNKMKKMPNGAIISQAGRASPGRASLELGGRRTGAAARGAGVAGGAVMDGPPCLSGWWCSARWSTAAEPSQRALGPGVGLQLGSGGGERVLGRDGSLLHQPELGPQGVLEVRPGAGVPGLGVVHHRVDGGGVVRLGLEPG